MVLSAVRWIIFDFDGTISNSQNAMLNVYQAISKKWDYPILDLAVLRNQSSQETLKSIGVSWLRLPAVMREARLQFQQHVASLQPIDGMKSTLWTLKEAKYQLGILTSNSAENVNTFLTKHDLGMFDFVFSGASLFGKGKLLKKILRKKKVSFEQAVYVGDETRDIDAARNAGVQVISVSWGVNAKRRLQLHQPDYLVDHPQELMSLFI